MSMIIYCTSFSNVVVALIKLFLVIKKIRLCSFINVLSKYKIMLWTVVSPNVQPVIFTSDSFSHFQFDLKACVPLPHH